MHICLRHVRFSHFDLFYYVRFGIDMLSATFYRKDAQAQQQDHRKQASGTGTSPCLGCAVPHFCEEVSSDQDGCDEQSEADEAREQQVIFHVVSHYCLERCECTDQDVGDR